MGKLLDKYYDVRAGHLSKEELYALAREMEEDEIRFREHLECASRTVNAWPEWKKSILGGLGYRLQNPDD